MDPAISAILFYTFALAAVLSAIGVVALRNPVSSALSMALCFGFTAAIFFGMGATFIGISQVIIYAGAILVLFLFIIMMINTKDEEQKPTSGYSCAIVGVIVGGMLAGMIVNASMKLPGAKEGRCPVHVLLEHTDELKVGQAATPKQAELSTRSAYGAALPPMAQPQGSDATQLGNLLFTRYNITFILLSFALLSGTVGAVAVGRKLRKD